MMSWLKKSQPSPLVLYKRVEKIEWTKGDAAAWTAVMGSDVYRKVDAFMHDRIINALLAGGDKQFLKGILYALSALEGFKGQENAEKGDDPKELSPIQFTDG